MFNWFRCEPSEEELARREEEQRQVKRAREKREAEQIWRGPVQSSYSTWQDAVRHVGDGKYVAETNYEGKKWTQSELLRTREEVEDWVIKHQGSLDDIRWPNGKGLEE